MAIIRHCGICAAGFKMVGKGHFKVVPVIIDRIDHRMEGRQQAFVAFLKNLIDMLIDRL